MLLFFISQTGAEKIFIIVILPAVPLLSRKENRSMNGSIAPCSVEKGQMPAKDDVKDAAALFSKLSTAAQDQIIDLIKSLLSKKG